MIDVLKSLLHSSARSALQGLRNLPVTAALEELVEQTARGRTRINDAELTAAVARLPGVLEATVSSDGQLLRVDVTFDNGEHLAFALRPAGLQFAAGGAKEISFALQPPDATSSKIGEVVAALGAEIARMAFRPVLAGAPRAEWTPHAMRDGDRVVFDLRSVPEIRWAQSRGWGRAALEVLRIRSIEVGESCLTVTVGIEGLKVRP